MPLGPNLPKERLTPKTAQRLHRHERAHRRADLTVHTPRRRPPARVEDERGARECRERHTRVGVAVVLEPPFVLPPVPSGERGGGREDQPRGAHRESVREPRRAASLAVVERRFRR